MTNNDKDILDHFFKDTEEQPEEVLDISKLSPLDNVDELVLIVDRSGSMRSILTDAEGGVNAFIDEQKQTGEANITLCEFDDKIDAPVYNRIPIAHAPEYKLRPRGYTALLDAIGQNMSTFRDVETTGQRIAVIVTDGAENRSKEWTKESVGSLIKELREDGWEFLFLAADEQAMQAGRSYGFDMNTSVQFAAGAEGAPTAAYSAVSTYSTNLRGGMKKSLAVAEMDKFVDDVDSLKKLD